MAEPPGRSFSYHRAVAPIMWVFVGLASIELVVSHLLVALWRPWAAVALSAVTLLGVLWLVNVIRSFCRLPVIIEDDRLVLRIGTLRRLDVPRDRVSGLRDVRDGEALKTRGVVKLSLLAYPNVVVDIDPPVASGRSFVHAVGHRLDDPAGFAMALDRWLARPSS